MQRIWTLSIREKNKDRQIDREREREVTQNTDIQQNYVMLPLLPVVLHKAVAEVSK